MPLITPVNAGLKAVGALTAELTKDHKIVAGNTYEAKYDNRDGYATFLSSFLKTKPSEITLHFVFVNDEITKILPEENFGSVEIVKRIESSPRDEVRSRYARQ